MPTVLSNALVLLDGVDISGDLNSVALQYGAESKDATTFGSGGWREKLGGLKGTRIEQAGFWEGGAAGIDPTLFSRIGATAVPFTVAPSAGAEGDPAYTIEAMVAEYTPGALIGEVLAFTASAESADALARGLVLLNATLAASADRTGRQLGAVASGQQLYAALHVLAIAGAGASLTVALESAPTSGFASPTTRATFDAATAVGGQWLTPVAGPITDTWWRASCTLAGTSPSVTAVLVAGIA